MGWKARRRLCELPSRGVTRTLDTILLDTPIRFPCPELPIETFVVTAAMECAALEVSFARLLPAPWNAVTRHWIAVESQSGSQATARHDGLTAAPDRPHITDRYKVHKPKMGQSRKTRDRNLPELFARLTYSPEAPYRQVQSEDGTITQLSEGFGSFDQARSVHLIDATSGPPSLHVYGFNIIRCANERAAGLRVGVCSEDGSQCWMLRISDARLCDASGGLVPGKGGFTRHVLREAAASDNDGSRRKDQVGDESEWAVRAILLRCQHGLRLLLCVARFAKGLTAVCASDAQG